MPRAARNKWLAAIVSGRGPKQQRDRHVCHALAYRMRGDGQKGCYPSQRNIAEMTGLDRRTVAAALARLVADGWIEREDRPTHYGRVGSRYFPAIPVNIIGASMNTPICRAGIGTSSVHQSNKQRIGGVRVCQSEERQGGFASIGVVADGIGASSKEIGTSRMDPKSLPEILVKGAAPLSVESPSIPGADEAERNRLRNRARFLASHYSHAVVATRMSLSEAEIRVLLDEPA